MTQEEKARAYEEAMNKIKPLYEQAKKDGNPIWSTYEYLIPQLAESEDERMMREFNDWLCEEIECRTNDLRDEKDRRTLNMLCYILTKVKDWLEKQKENPKFADSILLDCTSDAKCEDIWFKVAESTPADGRIVLAKDNIGNYLLASFAGGEWLVERYDLDDIPIRHTYVVEWCEIPLCQHDVNEIYRKGVKAGIEIANCNEQKEQKPVSNPKWAELTWKDINELERIINNVHYEFQNGIGEDSFGELVLERFKEYKDDGSMDEQKPAECERQPEFKEVEYDFRGEKVKVMRPFFRDDKGREFSTTGQDTDLTWSVLREWCEIKGITPFDLYPRAEWSEEDEKKLERVDDLLWMLDDYLGNDCSICEEKTARLRDEIHNELFPWLEFLRPQYHGDVTMTEAYKMGLEAGKASSWKPSEHQMTILKAVKEYVGRGSGYWGEALGSLIEDLEKL